MFQIALKSLRAKWRDYTVLFVGLVISAAIFYMLSAIALNRDFLLNNSSIGLIVPVFMVGEFLLGVITFVYLNFANSFLLRLRQSEYGLMSMLGAKKSQIGDLLMQETLALGVISTVIGIFAGIGLTAASGSFLMNLLDTKLANWSVFSFNAALATLVFFVALFFINGLYNRGRLSKQDTLTLLTADKQVSQPKRHKLLDPLLGLVGLGLLILSYVMMPGIVHLGLYGFIVVLVLNVWGTYWFVSRTLKMVTYALRGSRFNNRGLRSFLNGQLLFRLPEYQRILTVISVMFGLALGAMSVGQGYYRALPQQAQSGQPFTAAYTSDKISTSNLKDITWEATYHYSVNKGKVYFNGDEFNEKKLPTVVETGKGNDTRIKWLTGDYLLATPGSEYTLTSIANQILDKQYGATAIVTHNESEMAVEGDVKSVRLVTVKSFAANEATLTANAKREARLTGTAMNHQAGVPGMFTLLKNVFGGLEFMGIFLGIAFLAMLASTLMFKVLSGVADDKRRYRILTMIGTSKRQVTATVVKDLGVLFFIPLVIGTLDVIFGLPMFKALMADPYVGFMPSLIAIVVLYVIYFVMTVILYRRLLK
ncbi:FtsX-like permease family protein [Weissella cibaria]|uniref:FtsX-like permease family protein n=1 Tax=Weissella cibaria TaxID=137591 RepID=UPI0013DB2497|nr:ABC transporter permease [Weissella cibaria]NFA03201.1 ABC transporter permease [Weissella cibaria]